MTRRKFIHQLTQICSVIVAGAFTFARQAADQTAKLRKFIRAVPMGRYSGRVRPSHDISEQSKWSG